MKIIMWIGDEPNQRALANKINNVFPLSGIITETRHGKTKITIKKIAEKIIEKTFLSSIGKAWWNMQKHYDDLYLHYPKVKVLNVKNINSEEAYNFTKNIEPDLILVSGTRMVKEKMLTINPKKGILNLHTGLSPYIKGGPNSTNWCTATKQFHLIGNTIMWIDSGIDSGNILTTEFTELKGNETFSELHLKVMEHAHALYIKSVDFLNNGFSKSISQKTIDSGHTYYTKDWNLKNKIKSVINQRKMKHYYQSGKLNADRENIKIIKITDGNGE